MRFHQNIISILTLVQADGVASYACRRTPSSDAALCDYVNRVISRLPFVLWVPMVAIAAMIGAAALPLVGGAGRLRQVARRHTLRRIAWIPGYRTLVKFIRATCYLKLFDDHPEGRLS